MDFPNCKIYISVLLYFLLFLVINKLYIFFLSLSLSCYTLLNSANSREHNQYTDSFQKLFTRAIRSKKCKENLQNGGDIFNLQIQECIQKPYKYFGKKYFGKSIRKAQKSPEQWENVNKCFPEEGTQKARDRGNLSVYYPSIYHLKDILSQLIVVRGIQFETGMRKFYTYFIGEKCK